ncbi:MAG: 6,7-dimethyl-8-ribityllumazine synthase [Bacteroidia bacterium]|nr:6,7-dimethyl-8-ribityllumazine synthase [Bacteroidia bacterium]
MRTKPLLYTPPSFILERGRLFVLRTSWHEALTLQMWEEARYRLEEIGFPSERTHVFTVPGAFELPQLAAMLARHYSWRVGFSQRVAIQGPSHIQSNLRFPPFFTGNLESQLRAEFLLESAGPIGYLQPYEPGETGELPVLLTLGCILKGETEHNRYLAQAVFAALLHIAIQSGIPVTLGILTPDTYEQAIERLPQAREWAVAGFQVWAARLSFTKPA